jgi:hypothetical protein
MLTVCRKLIPVLRIIMLIRTRDQVIVSRFGLRALSQGLISVIIVSVLTIFLISWIIYGILVDRTSVYRFFNKKHL